MKNVEDILNKLYDYYEISGVNELSVKLGISPQNISNWKARNSINPLKTIIRQNGIYEKIFGESILRNASDLVDRLMEYYDVTTISELAEKINIGHQAISKWRKNNSIDAIKKRSRELGLYAYLFNDFEVDLFQSSEYDYVPKHEKERILKQQCKKYGVKLESVEIKNKRLLYLIHQIDKFANEKEINEVENILKDICLNIEPKQSYQPKFSDIDDEKVKQQMKENLEKAINKFEKEDS